MQTCRAESIIACLVLGLGSLGAACGGGGGTSGGGGGVDSGDDVQNIDAAITTQTRGAIIMVEEIAGGSAFTLTGAGFTSFASASRTTDIGTCTVERDTQTGPYTKTSAGPVTITDGSAVNLVLTPGSDGTYGDDEFSGSRYAGGDTVTVSAAGDTVPAFTSSITFPGATTVTSPASLTTLSKSEGLSLAWLPVTSSVHVVITQYTDQTSQGIDCTFDGASGSGDVPEATLSNLLTGSTANVLVATESQATPTAGNYMVEVLGAEYALTATVAVQP